MPHTPFTNNKEIVKLVQQAWTLGQTKQFSDVLDSAGGQYVDLVMEGGGVLGIGLVGYTYILEQAGIRFLSLAGTSAGSINAMLLAGVAAKDQVKSIAILDELAVLDLRTFMDGDDDAVDFIESALAGAGKFKMAFKGLQVVDNFTDDLGLCRGEAFRSWLAAVLKRKGVETTQQLVDRMSQGLSDLQLRDGSKPKPEEIESRIAVITAEICTETKVEMPRMASLFWAKPEAVCPADFVRASMSIPFFFHPFRVGPVPGDLAAKQRWADLASFNGKIPSEAVFVDGGIMSNFPIDLFHAPGVPSAPTFGVKLGGKKRETHVIDSPLSLAGAVFNSARHCLDFDFIQRNPDYKHLVGFIDTKGHNWLNFSMGQAEKIELFACGARAAVEFLSTFDWAAYKSVRAGGVSHES